MRLLLDEMHAPAVASALARKGFDAKSVAATEELRSLADAELLVLASFDDRVVVTENVDDFRRLAAEWALAGRLHCGILYTSRTRFPRQGKSYPGDLIRALDTFLSAPPGITGSGGWEWWLERA